MTSKSRRQFVSGNRGQTMIEVVITLGIALIIITSIMVLVNASNRRVTIARQATQGSKLAQEGMEIVRNIRDGDQNTVKVGTKDTSLGTVSCSTGSFCIWNDLYTDTQGTLNACLYLPSGASEWNLIQNVVGGDCANEQGIEGIFDREIEISDDAVGSPAYICSDANLGYSEVKRVSVKVSWESPIGNQKREVVSCLSNWR